MMRIIKCLFGGGLFFDRSDQVYVMDRTVTHEQEKRTCCPTPFGNDATAHAIQVVDVLEKGYQLLAECIRQLKVKLCSIPLLEVVEDTRSRAAAAVGCTQPCLMGWLLSKMLMLVQPHRRNPHEV